MYDKFALVLRVETTCNDVTFFKHHRRVEHRGGTWEMKLAPMKKSIYRARHKIKVANLGFGTML
jgi:hypothetical protein